jgi:hypothetical protein
MKRAGNVALLEGFLKMLKMLGKVQMGTAEILL